MTPTTALIKDGIGGTLTASPDNACPNYNVKLVLEYCRANNRTPESLTAEELEPFIEPHIKRKTA